MKTSHQLANELLAGPNLPIVIPLPERHSPDGNDALAEPVITPRTGKNTDDPDGPDVELLEIGYKTA